MVSEHTCGLTSKSHRYVVTSSGSILKTSLKNIQFISKIIRDHPNIKTGELRPFLVEYLPHFKTIDSDFCRSVRRRVLNYYVQKGWDAELDATSSSQTIERKKKGAAYEHIKSDCPTICNNVAAMYRKIMSQSNEVWNAEQYGEELKKEMTGFDY